MTKDEALKLARKVLGEDRAWLESDAPQRVWDANSNAVIAIDEVLAQPETPPECQTEAEKTAFAFGWFKAMEAQRLAQPKQEPVAWERHAKKLTDWLYCMSYNDSYFGEPAGLVKQVTSELNRLIVNAPPQREWVGLTDEDIKAVNAQVSQIPPIDYTTTTYAKAIEAKLKEKNR